MNMAVEELTDESRAPMQPLTDGAGEIIALVMALTESRSADFA